METINLDPFERAFTVLCELYDKKPSPAFYMAYREALVSKLGEAGAVQALKLAFERKTYGFPKPGDLIEAVRGGGEADALCAWEQLQEALGRAGRYNSVLFADPRIARVVQIMDGWLAVCDWPTDEMHFRRQEFVKAYKALPPGGDPIILAGITELDNRARGFLDHIPDPILIGDEPRRALPTASGDGGALDGTVRQLADHFGYLDA